MKRAACLESEEGPEIKKYIDGLGEEDEGKAVWFGGLFYWILLDCIPMALRDVFGFM